ncbi:MAG: hypothetical protein ACOZBZ_03565 [Patescibacteria group bacterium]
MRKIFTILILAVAIYSLMATPVFGHPDSIGASAVLKNSSINQDNRGEILRNFLGKYNSPLAPYAQEFVAAADSYGVDWKLVPAITGVESTFGKQIPFGSYNAYGWNNGDFRFSSWEDSIWYVTSQLRTRYLDRGAVSVSQIGRIYAPPSPFWPGKVSSFMAKIEMTSSFTLDL